MRLRFGGGSNLVGQGECVVEIWWWLRFCDGGGRGRPEVMAGGAVAKEMGVERESAYVKRGG